jgi:hypothetical protein
MNHYKVTLTWGTSRHVGVHKAMTEGAAIRAACQAAGAPRDAKAVTVRVSR